MSQKHFSKRLLVAAITTLLTASLASASDLVLCFGADGHRAIELEHGRTGCPTSVGTHEGPGVTAQSPAECFDLPAPGIPPTTLSSFDSGRALQSPGALFEVRRAPTPRVDTALRAPAAARTGPATLAPHLTSTVLLV